MWTEIKISDFPLTFFPSKKEKIFEKAQNISDQGDLNGGEFWVVGKDKEVVSLKVGLHGQSFFFLETKARTWNLLVWISLTYDLEWKETKIMGKDYILMSNPR